MDPRVLGRHIYDVKFVFNVGFIGIVGIVHLKAIIVSVLIGLISDT